MGKMREVDYPIGGIELGQGWDSETGNKKDAIGVVFVDPQDDLGQKKSMSLKKVSDRHSLMQALEISAEFQYKGLIYRAEAKGKFAKNVETSSIFESFVAQARVDNAIKYAAPAPDKCANDIASLLDKKKPLDEVKTSLNLDMQDYRNRFNVKPGALGTRRGTPKGTCSVRLTPDTLNMAKDKVDEFHRVYGDCFVSAITLGAELIAVMTFTEFNKEKREEIKTSIEGSGWGLTAKAGFKKKLEEYSGQNKLNINYYQAGGKGDVIPTDVEGFLAKIEELPALSADNPIAFKITLQRYDSLPNWPKGSEQPSITPYGALLRRYFEYETLWKDIDTILENQADYLLGRGIDEKSLKDMQDELMIGSKDILKVLETRGQKNATCEMPKSAQKSDYEFRIRMPIPRDYDENISVDMDRASLKDLISEFWIRTKSRECCLNSKQDPGCLSNKRIDEYKNLIKITPFEPSPETIIIPQKQKQDLRLENIAGVQFDKNITLEAWFNTDVSGKRQHIITKFFDKSKEPYYYFNLEIRKTGKLYFALAIGDKGRRCIDKAFDSVKLKTWYHVAATFNGEVMQLYLNGKAWEKKKKCKGPLKWFTKRAVLIGGVTTKRPFEGRLANVRIWRVARTEEQINANMNKTIPADRKGLVWLSTN